MYIHICIYVYTYIYIYTHTYIHMCSRASDRVGPQHFDSQSFKSIEGLRSQNCLMHMALYVLT